MATPRSAEVWMTRTTPYSSQEAELERREPGKAESLGSTKQVPSCGHSPSGEKGAQGKK